MNELTAPEWLNSNFIQDALRKSLRRGGLKVKNCDIQAAVAVGDNYNSQMFRAYLSICEEGNDVDEKIAIVIKTMPKGEKVQNFVIESNLFSKEATMLSETLPMIHKILRTAGINHTLSANMLHKQEESNPLIMLQDLCQDGFRSANRREGLDLHHSLLVMERLAVFHAASLVAIKETPSIKKVFHSGLWHRANSKNINTFIQDGLKWLAERVEVWGGWPPGITQNLKDLKATALEKLFDVTEDRENKLIVLNHGDTWTSNIMFKYSTYGVPVDLRFVDFQVSCCCSPVYDLFYFIFSSPKSELQVSQLDLFLKTYYHKLAEVCQQIKYDLNFTFEDFLDVCNRHLFYGFYVSLVIFPFITAPSDEENAMDDYLEEIPNKSRYRYLTEEFKKEMEMTLPYFIEKGILK